MSTLWVRHASSSAAIARRQVLAAFDDAGVTGEHALDAALIASELVGNAVRHAAPLPSGKLAVSWVLDSDGYQISVTDGGSPANDSAANGSAANGSPVSDTAAGDEPAGISVRHAGPQDTTGRGLRIVAELCDIWGVADEAGATTVWARAAISA